LGRQYWRRPDQETGQDFFFNSRPMQDGIMKNLSDAKPWCIFDLN
jgi:hypothetical protein